MTTPGTRKHPVSEFSSVTLADHLFDDDDTFGRNAPAAAMEQLNAHRRDRTTGPNATIPIPASDLWVILRRLAEAEQSMADKRALAATSSNDFDSPESRAVYELRNEIEQACRDALAECESNADAAGMNYTIEGVYSYTSIRVIGVLRSLGWIEQPPEATPIHRIAEPEDGVLKCSCGFELNIKSGLSYRGAQKLIAHGLNSVTDTRDSGQRGHTITDYNGVRYECSCGWELDAYEQPKDWVAEQLIGHGIEQSPAVGK